MRGGKSRNYLVFVLVILTGAVVGGILGELISRSGMLAEFAPYLVKTFMILDVPPVTINLYVVRFMIGLSFQPNLISIVGMIVAVVLFRRF